MKQEYLERELNWVNQNMRKTVLGAFQPWSVL